MSNLLSLILTGLLFVVTMRLQQTYPWPPDPIQIFGSGVHIVSGNGNDPATISESDTLPSADNQRRIIRVFDSVSREWREYPYPEDISAVVQTPQAWNDRLYLAASSETSGEHWIVWQLDLDSGVFELYEPCVNTVMRDTLLTGTQWVYVTSLGTNRVHLCNQATGELSDSLPDETSNWSDLLVSPEEDYLVLRGRDAAFADRGGPYVLYSYEVDTGTLNHLGGMSSLSYFSDFEGWLSNTQILYQVEDMGFGEGMYYVIDVSHPNSIESVITGWAQYRENPPRYEYLTTHAAVTRQADPHEHIPCTLDIFDLTTIEAHNFTLSYNCGGVYAPDDYRYFYVAFDSDPAASSSLRVLDIRSNTQTTILEGEIEALESVSPGGHYAAIITDDNDIIDRNTMEDTQFFSWSQTHNPMVSFVDVSSGEIIYQVPFEGWRRNFDPLYEIVAHSTYESGVPQVGVVWLDDHTCLVQHAAAAPQEREHILLRFDNGQVVETPIGGYAEVVVMGGEGLVIPEYAEDGTIVYSLYEVESRVKRPILINPAPEYYAYSLWVEGTGLLRLTVSLVDEASSYDHEWITYLLSVGS